MSRDKSRIHPRPTSVWTGYPAEIMESYGKLHPEDREDLGECGVSVRDVLFRPSAEGRDRFRITDILKDDCDGMWLLPFVDSHGDLNDGNDPGWHDLRHGDCYAVFADRPMSSPAVFRDPGYRYGSYDELLEEFRGKLEAYLPEDFGWDSHIGDFMYACYA